MIALAVALLAAATAAALAAALLATDVSGLGRRADDAGPAILIIPGFDALAAHLAPLARRHAPDACARLDRVIVEAGFPWGRRDGAWALGLGIALITLPGPVMGLVARTTFAPGTALFLGVAVTLGMVAYGYAELHGVRDGRRKRLEREFPYFLDFLVMVREAGATLDQALTLYRSASPATELGRSMATVLAGSGGKGGLVGALRVFAADVPSTQVRSGMISIVDADAHGARSTEMLRQLAEDQRARRSEAAERAAEKLKATSTVPMVVMFAGAFVMILSGSLGKMFNMH